MASNFWQNKKVFVTGHTGFKGGWLCLLLEQLGAELSGFSLGPPTTPNLFEAARVASGMRSILGDLRDLNTLKSVLSETQPHIIIHMAAQPIVAKSYEDPVETFTTNVIGSVNILEASRSIPSVAAIVNVTTDKCYENKEWGWGYRENEPLGGRDPYSASKACAELVSNAYRESFFAPNNQGPALATARAGNVIGGGDWAYGRLMTDLINSIESAKPINIRNPEATRPWQHVLEPLRGYLMLAENLFNEGQKFSTSWNFGPNSRDVKSVSWIIEKVSEISKSAIKCNAQSSISFNEANHLKLDITKAENFLDWRPVLDLSDALHMTVDWFERFYNGADAREITLSQIHDYQKRLSLQAEA